MTEDDESPSDGREGLDELQPVETALEPAQSTDDESDEPVNDDEPGESEREGIDELQPVSTSLRPAQEQGEEGGGDE